MKILRVLSALLVLVLALFVLVPVLSPAPSRADINGARYALLTASGNTVVKSSPGIIFAIVNLSTATQIVSVACYDNASTNSGNLLANYVSPAFLGPGQVVTFAGGVGVQFTNGATCNLSGSLTGTTAIAVYYL